MLASRKLDIVSNTDLLSPSMLKTNYAPGNHHSTSRTRLNSSASKDKRASQPASDKSLLKIWEEFVAKEKADSSSLLQRRVPFLMDPERKIISDRDGDLTLVTHLSVNKLDRLQTLVRWWNGPISVAVYCSQRSEAVQFDDFVRRNSILLRDVSVHALLELQQNMTLPYPHNILRNIALQNASGDFVFLIDADLIPSPPDAYAKLRKALQRPQLQMNNQTMFERMRHHKELLVVPVFEIYPQRGNSQSKGISAKSSAEFDGQHELGLASEEDFPRHKTRLRQMYSKNIARQWHFKKGHESSDYNHWLAFRRPKQSGGDESLPAAVPVSYPINPQPNYEPYFIGHRPSLPRYWEEFRGYGLNKQSFVAECIISGSSFRVLYDFWVSHLGHATNRDMDRLRLNQKIWNTTFVEHLRSTYNTEDPGLQMWLQKPPG